MQDYIYSVIAFLAMVVHLIINSDMLPGRKISDARGAREYRGFLAGVFLYYIVDAGWGVFAGLEWTRVLYLDTMVYYIAIAVFRSYLMPFCHRLSGRQRMEVPAALPVRVYASCLVRRSFGGQPLQ